MNLDWTRAEARKPRAKIIHAREWTKHKAVIIEIYLSSSLEALVERMIEKYNFCAV
jgi:hypothetical protein